MLIPDLIIAMLANLVKSVTGLGTTKMVLVVRTDIKMGTGKIASQCAHAAIILYEAALDSGSAPLKSWMYSGQPKVVLKVDENGDERLREMHEQAKSCGLNVCLVHDAGRTQLGTGTLTVLGIGPNKMDEIDGITGKLKLL